MDAEDIAIRNRESVSGRWPITKAEWRDCHPDYRSERSSPTHPSILAMDENGATCLYPVVIVPARLIREKV